MTEQTNVLIDFFPYFMLAVVLLGYFYFSSQKDDGSDGQVRELNARLNVLEDELDEACGHYVSTACHHANDDDNPALHARCRKQCKFCARLCGCECHEEIQ